MRSLGWGEGPRENGGGGKRESAENAMHACDAAGEYPPLSSRPPQWNMRDAAAMTDVKSDRAAEDKFRNAGGSAGRHSAY
jgi:hypothetical protein